jgi:DNA-binding transcriptional LysR family regulator
VASKSQAALIYSLSPTGARWTFSRGKRRETVVVQGPLRANSSLALRQAVLQGLSLAHMARFIVDPNLKAGRLVEVLPEWKLPEQGGPIPG